VECDVKLYAFIEHLYYATQAERQTELRLELLAIHHYKFIHNEILELKLV